LVHGSLNHFIHLFDSSFKEKSFIKFANLKSVRDILSGVDKMEIRHMQIVIVLTIIFLGAVYFFLEEAGKSGPLPEDIAKGLYMNAISLGENSTSYTYSYAEYANGYPENYTLKSDGNVSVVEIVNALSKKKVYFTDNDTIMCVDFQKNETCSSVTGDSITSNYVASLKGRLFSNAKITQAREDAEYRLEHELQTFIPSIKTKIFQNGDQCTQIQYIIDYSNATLEEMSRFGIVPGSPSHFETTSCIENKSGEIFESFFNYTFAGSLRTNRFELISSDFNSSPKIIVPSNLTTGAVDLLLSENNYRMQLVSCYLKTSSAQEKCIAMMALQMKNTDLCEHSGSRRDRCLVSLVPITRETGICNKIQSQEFKDDCFIELGGAYKNSTWCDNVIDSTKKQFCLNVSVATPKPAISPTMNDTNTTTNTSNTITSLPKEIQDIFDEIESSDSTNKTG
jgi:hypothetical protein